MEGKKYTCIVCPRSCVIEVSMAGGAISDLKGFGCGRGKAYAINEIENPVRMLTTTVCAEDGALRCLPVISTGEIQKSKIGECIEMLYHIKVKAPVREGQVIVRDILETGIDIVASRDLDKKEG